MCDISREENNAIKVQLVMNNIMQNPDVLDVIKSFVFQDKRFYAQKKEQKKRHDDLMKIINAPNAYHVTNYVDEGIGHWSIWMPPELEYDNNLQMQASNCLKCGKYVYVSTIELENSIVDNNYITCLNGQH